MTLPGGGAGSCGDGGGGDGGGCGGGGERQATEEGRRVEAQLLRGAEAHERAAEITKWLKEPGRVALIQIIRVCVASLAFCTQRSSHSFYALNYFAHTRISRTSCVGEGFSNLGSSDALGPHIRRASAMTATRGADLPRRAQNLFRSRRDGVVLLSGSG